MLGFLKELRLITSSKRGCTRLAYTDLETTAHDLAWTYASQVKGLERVNDAAGNTFIVPEASLSSDADPILLIGSHLDTVIEGGWLDGALGVAAGLYALGKAGEGGRVHPGLGVLIFRDEEGVRFQSGLFGSRVFAGLCMEKDLDVLDADGVSVRSVVPDPDGCVDYVSPVKVAAFLECHIEQGLRLEDRGARVGVVPGIVGIRRYRVTSTGVANHAGTTEMHRRSDALIPISRVVADLPSLVTEWSDAVITCGTLSVAPGAPNIVPGLVTAIVETRAGSNDILDEIEHGLFQHVAAHEGNVVDTGVKLSISKIVHIDPVHTDEKLLAELRSVLREDKTDFVDLPSMAGHDTQHAAVVCPSAMFFIPSIDGVSHNPREDSREEDIVLAGNLMAGWAERYLSIMA